MLKREPLSNLGILVYATGTIAAGIMDFIWGDFDASHQPIQAFGDHIPGREILAYISALWMIAGGAAILWRRSARAGGAALASIYFVFAMFWLPRFYTAPHFLGIRIPVFIGVLTGVGIELIAFARRSTGLRVAGNAQFVMAANDSYYSLDIWTLLNHLRLAASDCR